MDRGRRGVSPQAASVKGLAGSRWDQALLLIVGVLEASRRRLHPVLADGMTSVDGSEPSERRDRIE